MAKEPIIGACCFCGHEGEVYEFEDGAPGQKQTHRHCLICYRTTIGNRCVVPSVYHDIGTVKAIAEVGNLLLAAIISGGVHVAEDRGPVRGEPNTKT